MKTLAIIGSTGSIGKSSLKVLKKNKKKFKLIYLSCDKNYLKLKKQLKKFKPKYIGIDKKYYNKFKNLRKIKSINFFLQKKIKIDYIISGVSGFESIDLNFKLLKISRNLLLANKETIICGGSFFLSLAKKEKCNIIPLDSEHNSIYNYLADNKNKLQIKKIYLVASGGPFFNNKLIKYNEKIENVLKHPNWKMGKKITVDSSTFANKILELFEAKILFNLNLSQLGILVEQKSYLHAIIELKNNIFHFLCHKPNMEIPISIALGCNNKFYLDFNKLNFSLKKVDTKKFPLLKTGFEILKFQDSAMIIFTVINERLVKLFLEKKIKYGDISRSLIAVFKRNTIVNKLNKCIKSFEDIKKTIDFAKKIKL